MTYYDHNERILFGVKGLSLIGKGLWPGDFVSLHAVLMQFSARNIAQKFGDYLCRFRIMTTNDKQLITTRGENESLWLIGTSWVSDCDIPVPLTEVIEDDKAYQVYPNNPYGKVIATKVATQLRVELWHDVDNIDALATEDYMSKLLRALVEDGLQPFPEKRKQTDNITGESFVELGHSKEIDHKIIWADSPEVYSPAIIIQYDGEVQDAIRFLRRAELELKVRGVFEGDDYIVERHELGDAIVQTLLSFSREYEHFWELRLHSRSGKNPAMYDCGLVWLTASARARTEIKIRTLEPARFYQEWLIDYCARHRVECYFDTNTGAASGQSETAVSKQTKSSTQKGPNNIRGKPGRNKLSEREWIYRLAKAQEAEEIRAESENQSDRKTWAEIANEIGWSHGFTEAGLALLRNARNDLKRLEANDPDEFLRKVEEFRAKETKETK